MNIMQRKRRQTRNDANCSIEIIGHSKTKKAKLVCRREKKGEMIQKR
jgi:hypothetical protein